jgi:hypothetical protein
MLRGLSFMLFAVLRDTRVPGRKLNPSITRVVVPAPALTEGGFRFDSSGARLMVTSPPSKFTGSGFADPSKTCPDTDRGVEPWGAVVDVVKVMTAISRPIVSEGNVVPDCKAASTVTLPPPWLGLNVASCGKSLPGATLTTLKYRESKFTFTLTAFAVSFGSVSSSTETVVFPPRHAIALVTRIARVACADAAFVEV